MAIRKSAGPGRVFLRQSNLSARWADLVRRHMGRPSSSSPLGDARHKLGTGRLPVHRRSIRYRLLQLERRRQAEAGKLSRSGRRGRVLQPHLVLLLVRVRETASASTAINTRATNRDTGTYGLSPMALTHAHSRPLSITSHVHIAVLAEQRNRQRPLTQRQPRQCYYLPEGWRFLYLGLSG